MDDKNQTQTDREQTPFEKFEELAKKVLTTPKPQKQEPPNQPPPRPEPKD